MNKPTPLKVSAPVRRCPKSPKTSLDKTQSRVEKRRTAGVGLSPTGSSLSVEAFSRSLFQLLDSGVASVSDMRNGRPWPRPRIEGIRRLVEEHGTEVSLAAAKEAREIVQSQDRAPNVTALFEKKCADIAAERQAIRDEIRKAIG